MLDEQNMSEVLCGAHGHGAGDLAEGNTNIAGCVTAGGNQLCIRVCSHIVWPFYLGLYDVPQPARDVPIERCCLHEPSVYTRSDSIWRQEPATMRAS